MVPPCSRRLCAQRFPHCSTRYGALKDAPGTEAALPPFAIGDGYGWQVLRTLLSVPVPNGECVTQRLPVHAAAGLLHVGAAALALQAPLVDLARHLGLAARLGPPGPLLKRSA